MNTFDISAAFDAAEAELAASNAPVNASVLYASVTDYDPTTSWTPDEEGVDERSMEAAATGTNVASVGDDHMRASSPQHSSRVRKRTHSRSPRQKSSAKKGRSEQRTSPESSDTHGNIVAANVDHSPEPREAEASSNFYWEVEKVLARRSKRRRVEYLIKWKNCPDGHDTWEPISNLCDTALAAAKRLDREEKEWEKAIALEEAKLGILVDLTNTPTEDTHTEEDVAKNNTVEDEVQVVEMPPVPDELERQWRWNDAEQVHFRDVVRIHVHDTDARDRVTEARMNGTPVVLVGHKGWANFAKRWLKHQAGAAEEKILASLPKNGESDGDLLVRVSAEAEDVDVITKPSLDGTMTKSFTDSHGATINHGTDEELLDLSDPTWELDIQKLRDDVGSEIVPVVRRNCNGANPITANISANKYFKVCWPDDNNEDADSAVDKNNLAKHFELHLHSWQFPLSESAGRKLCHQNTPLPNDIFGEDLLKYWSDLPHCKSDSCFQYISLGREDTLSKLHKDFGGLEITVAPIVGEKECVLVHRSDGSNCLYHMLATLDNIDLHRYPLVSQARIWKTVIKPGEILLLPQSTYHQCRNLTTCLSYSRFHLDTVNLLAFLQSMFDGDAPEMMMQHDEILRNCTTALIKSVDRFVDAARNCVKAGTTASSPPLLDERLVRHVNTLRSLRHIVREIARKLAVRYAVKGNGETRKKRKKTESPRKKQRLSGSMVHTKSVLADNSARDWDKLVDDVDLCLYRFRYRGRKIIPKFRKRKVKASTNAFVGRDTAGSPRGASTKKQQQQPIIVAYNTDLENAYLTLENAPKSSNGINGSADAPPSSIEDVVKVGDIITVRLKEKQASAEVLLIELNKSAAYLTYDDYPALYDEYQPFEVLRTLNSGGGTGVEMPEHEIHPGCVVTSLEKKGEYRATVKHIVRETMLKVNIIVGPKCTLERWITMSLVLQTAPSPATTTTTTNGGEPFCYAEEYYYPSTANDWKMKAEKQLRQGSPITL